MPVCPAQMLVELGVMVEGAAGAAPTVTASVRAMPLPLQLLGVTLIVPPLEPVITLTLLVP